MEAAPCDECSTTAGVRRRSCGLRLYGTRKNWGEVFGFCCILLNWNAATSWTVYITAYGVGALHTNPEATPMIDWTHIRATCPRDPDRGRAPAARLDWLGFCNAAILLPSALAAPQRKSMRKLRPTVHPNSCSPCNNAALRT